MELVGYFRSSHPAAQSEAMQPMFRAMKEEGDGLPVIGRSGRTLGVRVEGAIRDIPVAPDGTVAPASGGMSVALDDLIRLHKPRLPRSLGGEGRDPVFRALRDDLPTPSPSG